MRWQRLVPQVHCASVSTVPDGDPDTNPWSIHTVGNDPVAIRNWLELVVQHSPMYASGEGNWTQASTFSSQETPEQAAALARRGMSQQGEAVGWEAVSGRYPPYFHSGGLAFPALCP